MDTRESEVHAILIIDAYEELEMGGQAELTRFEVALYASIMLSAALAVVFGFYLFWWLFKV